MSNLTDKFIKGLQNYNLKKEDMEQFKYCGGNKGSHFNYFKIFFRERLQENPKWSPVQKDHCICGHIISENCYIINNTELILILGNCCIKKFVPTNKRSCEKCGNHHRNRNVNRCNECRFGVCDYCNKKCGKKYHLCWDCANGYKYKSTEQIIRFGKYNGQTYKDILSKDKNYLLWLLTEELFHDKNTIKQLLT